MEAVIRRVEADLGAAAAVMIAIFRDPDGGFCRPNDVSRGTGPSWTSRTEILRQTYHVPAMWTLHKLFYFAAKYTQ
jgi:hypothetical protein